MVATFCTIGVGIWQASIYRAQLTAIQGQLTQMQGSSKQTDALLCLYRQQLAELQRQSIDTHGFAVASTYQALAATQTESAEVYGVVKNPWLTPNSITIKFGIKNVGKTAAHGIKFKVNVVIGSRHGDPKFSYSPSTPRGYGGNLEGGESPLGFDPYITTIAVHDTKGGLYPVDQSTIDAYNRGETSVFIYGIITYTDIFDVKHRRTFCDYSDHPIPGEITRDDHPKCAAYNKEDINRVVAKPSLAPTRIEIVQEIPCSIPKTN